MKKILLTLAAAGALLGSAVAQTTPPHQRFVFSHSESSYQPLSAEAEKAVFPEEGDEWDDDVSEPIGIPFEFKYQNVNIPAILAEGDGYIDFDGVPPSPTDTRIIAFGLDLVSEGRGKVLYETTGTEGSRIFKIEYRNASTYENYTGNDTVNFQVWFYEGSNVIEFRPGYCNIPAEHFASTVEEINDDEVYRELLMLGLFTNEGDRLTESEDDLFFHYVSEEAPGSFDNALLGLEAIMTSPEDFLVSVSHSAFPESGKVFRYTPIVSSKADVFPQGHLSIYPNPASDNLHIELLNTDAYEAYYTLYDIFGRELSTAPVRSGNVAVPVSHLPSGQYLIKVTNGQFESVLKFVKN